METTCLVSRQVMEIGGRILLTSGTQTSSNNKCLVLLEEVFESIQPGHLAQEWSVVFLESDKWHTSTVFCLSITDSVRDLYMLPENFASASSSYFFHSHGNKEVFSCWGIRLAVDWFRERGHTYIKVFVPLWRKEPPRQDSPIAGTSPSWA